MANDETYRAYAAVYDALGQWHWGAALARFALATLSPEHGPAARRALDLACGTGASALVLAGAGIPTVGLDRSAAMLARARTKARSAGLPLAVVRGDLRAFAFRRPFDLITCCYDSLNYLTEPVALLAALRCVRGALTPRGRFICDLTTRAAYTGELDGLEHDLALGDLAYRWTTRWDEAAHLATTTLTVRSGREPDGWRTERHVQRAYAPDDVAEALLQAGLRPLATYAAGRDAPERVQPEASTPRVVYVATRAN